MGSQQSCRCERSSVDASDGDGDSPVVPAVEDARVSDARDFCASATASDGAAARMLERGTSSDVRTAPDAGPRSLTSDPDAPPTTGTVQEAGSQSHSRRARRAGAEEGTSEQKSNPAELPTVVPKSRVPAVRPKGSSKRREGTIEQKARKAADPPRVAGTSSARSECPGIQLAAEVETERKGSKGLTPLQKIKQRKLEEEKKLVEMRQVVDNILAGKLEKKGTGGQPSGDMRITMPSPFERKHTRELILESFRAKYRKLRRTQAPDAGLITEEITSRYTATETAGLSIKDGHRYMPRPQGVQLPKDFQKPVGTMPLEKLKRHNCRSPRMLLSVYGDIFDVSDRPDKYGEDGPYSWMTGCDLSWGFVSGKDTPDEVDKLYDMWKIAPRDFQQRKLQALLAWVAFYEFEYGKAVGRLQEYEKEAGLKGPPMEQAEDCCVM